MEKDGEHRPGSVGECHDQLAMSTTGKEKEVVWHSSHGHRLPEVSPIAFYGAVSQMYQQLGALGQE